MALGPIARTAIHAAGTAAVRKALSPDEEAEKAESTDVQSSAISNIAWKDEVITVTFHQGGTHDYPGSKDLYKDFIAAPSIGAYFNKYIRERG